MNKNYNRLIKAARAYSVIMTLALIGILCFSAFFIDEGYSYEWIMKTYALGGSVMLIIALIVNETMNRLGRYFEATISSVVIEASPAIAIGLFNYGMFFFPFQLDAPEVPRYYLGIQVWNWYAWAAIIGTIAFVLVYKCKFDQKRQNNIG